MLRLPRDAASVAVIRQILDSTLLTLGVVTSIRDDIKLILSEACSNAIRHAVRGHDYTVQVAVTEDRCTIRVIDEGEGFELDTVPAPPNGVAVDLDSAVIASPVTEHGRGLQIMRALADDLHVIKAEHSSAVSVEKFLRFYDDAPGRVLRHPLVPH
ncbi:serine/threonine-protein kinase RsbW [Thermostaphylospora chromogena]|uniref:Serine/threonine-protein kinase RsbW n=1 Tax=Thermostaphylospora chromogena TaxID=35622 RepID=A0A1H1GX30_9ACTN|nr:serine/threonine-protein kinase RsbW [Thermostaphylospora chromogena]